MKVQLLGGWPCGQFLIPSDTILDDADPAWAGVLAANPLPINAIALDQDAADALSRTYPHDLDRLRAGPGVTIRKLVNV